MSQLILEKIYAGFLGMNIGIRLGAPVEPTVWTSDRIKKVYGEIADYVKPFKNFAADDDVNGPVFFLRSLFDKPVGKPLTVDDVAEAWLNYTREGMGMFWWGGYGTSTEHTAYLNLKHGIHAPQSGSSDVNGLTIAEQIGGQIFIDTWGLIFPANPEKAGRYAMMAASVSHDKNGIYGAGFIAACIAAAFNTSDVKEIIQAGLACIPADSTYTAVVHAALAFHHQHPENWRDCLEYLQLNWGYDRYPGVCHIIPNAGVCVMSMLYGNTFAKTVEIAAMAGWDTDCNAGNVGTIMGVARGLLEIPSHYRAPINDSVVLSGISGYLNILDIPTYANELYRISQLLSVSEAADLTPTLFDQGGIHFDFELPGATHNFRISNPNQFQVQHTFETSHTGKGSLAILFDRLQRGDQGKVFYKPFYRRSDFDDTRYMPVFSPTAYPGQRVSFWVCAERFSGEDIIVSPYVRNTFTGKDKVLYGVSLKEIGWKEISFVIPEMDGAMVDEIGMIMESNSSVKNKDLGYIFLDDFSITGKANYRIQVDKCCKEFESIIPFSHHHGAWNLVDGRIEAMSLDGCEAFTGNYFMQNIDVCGSVMPLTGKSHLISARVQGAQRGYYAGFEENHVVILKKEKGKMCELASALLDWRYGEAYEMRLKIVEDSISFALDGKEMLFAIDDQYRYGMVGYAMNSQGRSSFGDLSIKELDG